MLGKIALSCVAATGLFSSPSLANETTVGVASSTSAVAGTGAVDKEFSALFASWENLETGGRVTQTGEILAAPKSAVSVPSRMPVDGVSLTSGFGMRDHPILRQRRRHNGVDLAAAQGTPVYATGDGMIGKAQYFGTYGNYVQIEHGGALQTRYAHLSSYTVNAGETVAKGDLIGYIGSTGRSTGPHLHYEVRVDGEPVNPIPYMVAELELTDDEQAARGGPE